MSEPKLVTAQTLANMLQLSVETIWRYTRNGKIPYVQLANRQYRYEPNAVMQQLGVNTGSQSIPLACEAQPEYRTDKVYTYDDYLLLPNEERYHYEILDGMLVREPAPYVHHQRVSRRLQRLLEDYFALRDATGELFDAPIDMTLSDTNVIQPDLVYIPGECSAIVEEKRINGVPYLVVEVISKWTRAKDRLRKRNIYERMRVPHYWVVDPQDETIEAYALHNNAYILRSSGLDTGEFTHPDFPEFQFDLAELWKRPAP
jgi:Uma2 family endonuclease